MWLMVVNGITFAIMMVLVVAPPLFIYDPQKHKDQALGPPSAGEVIPSDSATESVKQKLYMLFMIPACATVNAICFYFTYYRPMRYVVYRVEQNTLSLYQNRLHGDQLLRNVGINVMPGTDPSVSARRSQSHGSVLRQPTESISVVASNAAAESSHYRINLALRTHARPKSVRRDVFVTAAVLPEIKALRDEIEKNFLEPSQLSEKNFVDAVHNAVDSFLVTDPTAPVIQLQEDAGVGYDAFYTSARPRLAMDIGKNASSRPKGFVTDANFNASDSPTQRQDDGFRRADRSMVLLVSDRPLAKTDKKGRGGSNSPKGSE